MTSPGRFEDRLSVLPQGLPQWHCTAREVIVVVAGSTSQEASCAKSAGPSCKGASGDGPAVGEVKMCRTVGAAVG